MPPTPPAAQGQPGAPAAQGSPPPAGRPSGVGAPPRQARDASEFIRRGDQPGRRIDDVRRERQETREGNRTFIREGDRTIVRDGNRTIIRHNELDRFAIGARNIGTERRGNRNVTVIERGNGVRVITVTDDDGRLIRRTRRNRDGREFVIIDNDYRGPRRPGGYFVDVPPPAVRIPRERYILEAERADPAAIYGVFTAAPVAHLSRRYTLDEVRYSEPLRQYMPRVDLDVTFDSGSWQLSPDQLDRLAAVAEGLNRAIEKNPREVFLIEGHTDAVGADVDNLSLSDRRAEAVAVALTEQFQVPAENLVTQGYGEQYLKVQTQGDERANRRVAVRRITPLIEQAGN
jgi:outer membrane protein OmpA-like peptidoglycan-associated protein